MLWSIWVFVIPVVVGALGTVSKGLERGLEEQELVKESGLSRERSEYWEESWRSEEIGRHSESCKRPVPNVGVKYLQGVG